MSKLTYSQLEGVWIQAGGQKSLAPLMAAIALAESGGQTNALNNADNGGRQSSYGLWQISTGTHTAPDPNWADPLVNARLAVGKLKSQGLNAWGTYTSGAYKPFLANGVAPTAVSSTAAQTIPVGETENTATCAWNIHLPVAGDTCVFSKIQLRSLLGIGIIGVGGFVGIIGLVILVAYGLGKNPGALLPKGVMGRVAQSGGNTTV